MAFFSRLKNVFVNSKITEINLKKREIKIGSQNKEKFDYLIYTLPLPEIANLIKGLSSEITSSCNKLRWNSIFNLNLGIDRVDNSGKHWIYFPQKELSFFRVGFPHNFSPEVVPPKKCSLYVEVSYPKDKLIDKNAVVAKIKKDLKKAGILRENCRICTQDMNDIKYGYPIYDKNYSQAREDILNFLRQDKILTCGRYGSWKYMTMEDVILDGKRAAENIIYPVRENHRL